MAPIFMIAIYAKNEKIDMTAAEKKASKKFVQEIKKQYAMRRNTSPKLRIVKSTRKGK